MLHHRLTTPAVHRCRVAAALAAILVAGTVVVDNAGARPTRRSGPTKVVQQATNAARQRLTRLGYRHVQTACARRGSQFVCRWRGERNRFRCTGVATALRRGRTLTTIAIHRRACTRLSGGSSSPKIVQPARRVSSGGGGVGGEVARSNPQLGFNTYTTTRTLTEQRELGATVSRLFVDWALVEPSPGQWDWQQTDNAYSAMVAAGLKPLVVVYTAPCWARPSTDCSNPAFTGPPDPAYDDQWSAFVRAAAQRYPGAVGIEVWNEPNLDQSFLPRANPTRFAAVLAAAYHAVRSVDAAMPVISGGLLLSPSIPGSGQVPGGYGAAQFLAAMYGAGASRTMDALAVHIYPSDYVAGVPTLWDPAAMQAWLRLLDPVRAAAGASGQPMWITEMGVSTSTQAGWPAASTPGEQASDLGAMLAIARATPNVPYVIVHSLEDQTPNYDDPYNAINTGWGVFTDSGVAKPAACVISTAFHGSLSCS